MFNRLWTNNLMNCYGDAMTGYQLIAL